MTLFRGPKRPRFTGTRHGSPLRERAWKTRSYWKFAGAVRLAVIAPGPMDIEEDEQIGGSVALVLAIVALKLTLPRRDRRPHLADELDRALVEASDSTTFGIGSEHNRGAHPT